jgi:hypothetical protein
VRLIIVGCEYSGTTTLAKGICRWASGVMGGRFSFHDHWKMPEIACYPEGDKQPVLTDEDKKEILALSPKLKEMLQRQSLNMHMPAHGEATDFIMVGFHLDDAVYGPLYFNYGGEDEPQGGPRTRYARFIEAQLLKLAPDVTLVSVKASPEVVARRVRESPHADGVLREADIEHVLRRFEEETGASLIKRRLTLDTSEATPEETLARFVRDIEALLTESDRLRMLAHRALRVDA